MIYWRDENVLFSFPTAINPEVVDTPSVVVARTWKLNQESFRPPGDKELETSTYLESWDWALQELFECVVRGDMYQLKTNNHQKEKD